MANQYSARDFLRQVSNTILQEYFKRYEKFKGVSFDPKEEADVESIFLAMGELSDKERTEMEKDFISINAMATEGGIKTLVEVSQFDNNEYEDLAPILGEIEGLHDQVFRSLLDYRDTFEEACRLYSADSLPGRSWRKRGELPEKKAATDDISKKNWRKQYRHIIVRRKAVDMRAKLNTIAGITATTGLSILRIMQVS